jgi:hypothetical protein
MEPIAEETSTGPLREIAVTAKKLNGSLSMSVRPLFFEDEHKRNVRLLASCVLTTINGAKFIFTAGHVMRRDGFRNELSHVPVALATPEGRLVSFKNAEGVCTGLPGEGQDLDVGFVRLVCEARGAFEDCHFLAEDECELNHKDDRTGNSFYLLIGYPGSRKVTKIWERQIMQFSFCICTYPKSEAWHERLSLPANRYILLDWNENNVKHNGVRRNTPKMSGISGGGVFHVDGKTGKARLVGIITELHKQSKLIVATRIDHFTLLATVYNGLPELRKLLRTKPGTPE